MEKIRFYTDATKTGLPLIKVQEGEFEGMVLLVDTGSTDNYLFGGIYDQLQDLLEPVEGTCTSFGIDGISTERKLVGAKLSFCGKNYTLVFMLIDGDEAFKELADGLGFPVCGIIGTRFMAEHSWKIDFAKQVVEIPDYDFDFLSINFN